MTVLWVFLALACLSGFACYLHLPSRVVVLVALLGALQLHWQIGLAELPLAVATLGLGIGVVAMFAALDSLAVAHLADPRLLERLLEWRESFTQQLNLLWQLPSALLKAIRNAMSGRDAKFARARLELFVDTDLGQTELVELKRALLNNDWNRAREILQAVDLDRLWFLLERAAATRRRAAFIERWPEVQPGNPYAHLLNAAHLIHRAWRIRGKAVASSVSYFRARGFFSHLSEAQAHLARARGLLAEAGSAHNVAADMFMLEIHKCRGESSDASAALERIRLHDPECFHAHLKLLEGLAERWGGTHAALFDFVDKVAREAMPGSLLHALVPFAHIEAWVDVGLDGFHSSAQRTYANYFDNPEVRAHIVLAYEHFCEDRVAIRELDSARVAGLNAFAFAFLAIGDSVRAREILQLLGGRASEHPWGLLSGAPVALSDGREAYRQVYRQLAISTPDKT